MSLIIAEKIDELDENTRVNRAKREGLQEGEQIGEIKAKKETAKKMLELGLEIEVIEKTTELSKEEIMKLKEK